MMDHQPLKIYWRVRYMLKGELLDQAEVEAKTEAQALAVARSKVKPNIRHIADETKVEKLP